MTKKLAGCMDTGCMDLSSPEGCDMPPHGAGASTQFLGCALP